MHKLSSIPTKWPGMSVEPVLTLGTLYYSKHYTSTQNHQAVIGPNSGEASLMRVVMLFRNQRGRCESDAHGGGVRGNSPGKF